MSSGADLDTVQELIEEALEAYLLELRESWEDSDTLVVRISQIESTILGVTGVTDIESTTINNQESNIELEEEYIPILGDVEVSE